VNILLSPLVYNKGTFASLSVFVAARIRHPLESGPLVRNDIVLRFWPSSLDPPARASLGRFLKKSEMLQVEVVYLPLGS